MLKMSMVYFFAVVKVNQVIKTHFMKFNFITEFDFLK